MESFSLDKIRSRNTENLRDNSQRAKVLIYAFWIFIAISVIAVISDYIELQLLKRAQFGLVTEAAAMANDQRQGVIGILQIGIYLTTIAVFLSWFYRAYRNLGRLGVQLRHREDAALYSWIIPFVCLFWPVQIMKEIWSKTQWAVKRRDPAYIFRSGGLIIGIWWLLFVFSNFFGKYILRTAWNSETIEDYIASSQATLLSDLLQIPEALLVILIVSRLSGMGKKLAA